MKKAPSNQWWGFKSIRCFLYFFYFRYFFLFEIFPKISIFSYQKPDMFVCNCLQINTFVSEKQFFANVFSYIFKFVHNTKLMELRPCSSLQSCRELWTWKYNLLFHCCSWLLRSQKQSKQGFNFHQLPANYLHGLVQ